MYTEAPTKYSVNSIIWLIIVLCLNVSTSILPQETQRNHDNRRFDKNIYNIGASRFVRRLTTK
jgi:hypothetical protein